MNDILFYAGILTSAFPRLGGSWSIAHLDYDGLHRGPSMECTQEMKSQGKTVTIQLKDSKSVSLISGHRCNLPVC